MRFLISDYSSEYSTEPLYLNTIFNSIGCSSTIWPQGTSAFDAFDITNPNVFITHFTKVNRDIISYLKDRKDIEIVVNITNMKQEHLTNMESIFYSNGIKPSFYFVNAYDHNLKSNKTNINVILHGADILFGKINKFFDIEYGIFVEKQGDIYPAKNTFHYISTNQKMSDAIDIAMPAHKLIMLYPSYRKIVFRHFDNIFHQSFFDAAYYSECVFYDISDRSVLDSHLQKLFGESGLCSNEDSGNISSRIKQKHTCLHRAKSMLSQLPCKEFTDRLQSIMGEQLV